MDYRNWRLEICTRCEGHGDERAILIFRSETRLPEDVLIAITAFLHFHLTGIVVASTQIRAITEMATIAGHDRVEFRNRLTGIVRQRRRETCADVRREGEEL